MKNYQCIIINRKNVKFICSESIKLNNIKILYFVYQKDLQEFIILKRLEKRKL